VNLGDVIEEGDRIYGDGVNIAARLEGLAEAGGICISGSAHEQIKNKLALGYEYIGEHTVKNIAEPLKVYRVPMGPKAVTSKERDEKKTKSKKWQWTSFGAAGAIIVIIGALAIWYFSFRQAPVVSDVEEAPVVAEVKEAPKTIAVLPFVDISPEKDQEYFVDGLSEEILNSLTQIPDLGVTARTSSFFFKGTNKNVQEIANALGVDYILEGSVRKAGNALRITAQLVQAADGLHLFSKTYDRELKEIFAVQEDIATSVADELKVTLGIERSLRPLGGTDNVDAYELYLVAIGQFINMEYPQSLESVDAAIALDPDFALAWTSKGLTHLWIAQVSSPDQISLAQDAALEAALRAIELEPNLPDGYIILGSVHTARGEFNEAELVFRKGMELTTEITSYFSNLAFHYTVVCYLRKCLELNEEMRRNDPLDPIVRAAYMLNLGYLGDMERVEEEYRRGKEIFGDQWLYGNFNISWLRLGAKDILSINEIPESLPAGSIWAIAREHIGSPEEGLAELRRLYSSNDNLNISDFQNIACWAAYFGDPEFALNAMERSVSLSTMGLYFIWGPLFHEVRQLPRFKEFVREIGLVDFWNKFGWPDLCHPVGEDDFECN
jgi:adenylate cyclase